MKTVILCGGKGLRMGENEIPKPLAKIGGEPILWHIMKIYVHFGFTNFILPLGYKGKIIRHYFATDCQEFKSGELEITFVETGISTNTGGRIKRLEPFIDEEVFFVTYADGLADIDFRKLEAFHMHHAKIATLTAVRPTCPFGVLEIGKNHIVKSFREKPKLELWINGGFFVFNRAIFRTLSDSAVLEGEVFEKLASLEELVAYPHEGFWACMDTQKDLLTLQEMWEKNQAPWRVWQDEP